MQFFFVSKSFSEGLAYGTELPKRGDPEQGVGVGTYL